MKNKKMKIKKEDLKTNDPTRRKIRGRLKKKNDPTRKKKTRILKRMTPQEEKGDRC